MNPTPTPAFVGPLVQGPYDPLYLWIWGCITLIILSLIMGVTAYWILTDCTFNRTMERFIEFLEKSK